MEQPTQRTWLYSGSVAKTDKQKDVFDQVKCALLLSIYPSSLCMPPAMDEPNYFQVTVVSSGAAVRVSLHNFNGDGKDIGGHCCDGRIFGCIGRCEPYFLICVTSNAYANLLPTYLWKACRCRTAILLWNLNLTAKTLLDMFSFLEHVCFAAGSSQLTKAFQRQHDVLRSTKKGCTES